MTADAVHAADVTDLGHKERRIRGQVHYRDVCISKKSNKLFHKGPVIFLPLYTLLNIMQKFLNIHLNKTYIKIFKMNRVFQNLWSMTFV